MRIWYDNSEVPFSLDSQPNLKQTVQRFALQALNSAARNKPHLIRDHLASLTPQLYKATDMKPDLIEVVQMGPWQHKVDKGLEVRKAAYETMYTLVGEL